MWPVPPGWWRRWWCLSCRRPSCTPLAPRWCCAGGHRPAPDQCPTSGAGHRRDMTQAGLAEVTIPPGTVLRRCLARRSDLVLYVLTGHADVLAGGTGRTVGPGEATVCPRGRPWQVRSRSDEVRLLALAVPAGPEAVLWALTRSAGLDDATLL